MDTSDLVNKIRGEAGYFLYMWATRSPKYTDAETLGTSINELETSNTPCYNRAIHNLKEPSSFIDITMGSANHIRDSFKYSTGIDCPGGDIKNYLLNPEYSNYDYLKFFDMLLHGALSKTDEHKAVGHTDENASGSHVPLPLNSIVETSDSGNAYFLLFGPKCKNLRDGGGRNCNGPDILLFTNEKLYSDLLEHIKGQPKDYHEIIRGMFPSSEFPKVSKNIISRMTPLKKLIIFDSKDVAVYGRKIGGEWRREDIYNIHKRKELIETGIILDY